MKRTILLLLIFHPFFIYAQKIVKNEKDNFTGASIIETSWEPLTKSNKLRTYIRGRKVDSTLVFDVKISLGGTIFSISDGDEMMLKLSSGDVIVLKSLETKISRRGGGATGIAYSDHPGVNLSYCISEGDIEKIKRNKIVSVRVYTNSGYAEHDVNPKDQQIVSNIVYLF